MIRGHESAEIIRTANAQQCAILELGLDSVLDLAIRLQINRGAGHPHVRHTPQRPGERTYVASSRTTTLQSFTSARARLNNDRSPTLRLAPSLSITLSNVYRVVLSSPDSSATRQDLRSASHSLASSYLLNGSRFDRIVPLKRRG